MITNIITIIGAVVTSQLQTNVVEGSNATGCPLNKSMHLTGDIIILPGPHPRHEGCAPYIPPTAKWTITNVVVVHTLKFTWESNQLEFRAVEPRFSTTNKWKLQSTWIEDK